MEKITPVYILSGFLGSGKTTLLQRLLRFWQDKGLRPAVIMNEIGDVNLDGLLVPGEVPMAEMLGGCICCTIRGDLSVQMAELISAEKPDLVVIEATGAGNPLEIFDAVTEVSLYLKLEIKPMITVVDAAHLAELHDLQKGKTYRLMLEQIRCGSVLILNKIDMIGGGRQREMIDLLSKLNPYAQIVSTVKCEVDIPGLLSGGRSGSGGRDLRLGHEENDYGHGHEHGQVLEPLHEHQHEHKHEHELENKHKHEHKHKNEHRHEHEHQHERKHEREHEFASHDHEHNHDHNHNHDHDHHYPHTSHEHVTVYTHYFNGPVDSEEFERFIAELPREVYRGKGVLTFTDTASRFLFQYAYREADYLKITPQGEVPDVAVFIGEHFDRELIARRLKELERKQA
ncbi:GTP-binding protein [Paenibacillus macerans]|uniref:CobW family GTP-binding protein n=1 Tax=Paenibacillus macerans TaxID=44252 RepID=UPI002DB6AFA6|nr:CobW family GTP-binding protein [Paenibacillus macerans]MEC0331016.1 GTP-binding protein [Paenibacillus macerans]